MSNLLLKQLREAGIITGEVLPFARSAAAHSLTDRFPDRVVMVFDSINSGDFWVVSAEDAARLEAAGYMRHVQPGEPTGDTAANSP